MAAQGHLLQAGLWPGLAMLWETSPASMKKSIFRLFDDKPSDAKMAPPQLHPFHQSVPVAASSLG